MATATVQCITYCDMLTLTREQFDRVVVLEHQRAQLLKKAESLQEENDTLVLENKIFSKCACPHDSATGCGS